MSTDDIFSIEGRAANDVVVDRVRGRTEIPESRLIRLYIQVRDARSSVEGFKFCAQKEYLAAKIAEILLQDAIDLRLIFNHFPDQRVEKEYIAQGPVHVRLVEFIVRHAGSKFDNLQITGFDRSRTLPNRYMSDHSSCAIGQRRLLIMINDPCDFNRTRPNQRFQSCEHLAFPSEVSNWQNPTSNRSKLQVFGSSVGFWSLGGGV